MFDIFIQTHFSAGHHLRDNPGNCERPHGHNWHVEITMRATRLDELGMGIDFRTIKDAAARVMKELDHCDLNEHPSFKDKNPSSENLAVYIFDSLKEELQHERYKLYSILVGETPSSAVIYREE
ncbi:MAG: 6-carboxytetrahydropterin synthase QueD [Deltaproteobacteria bacterium]|jgi:6-pyruvoyltetrahydropterin/6-carboxytetrahydropterin synthase|nr:6-carboxytetrahydropterin synthase QueD [Deltaproteobacteria bacterium]